MQEYWAKIYYLYKDVSIIYNTVLKLTKYYKVIDWIYSNLFIALYALKEDKRESVG